MVLGSKGVVGALATTWAVEPVAICGGATMTAGAEVYPVPGFVNVTKLIVVPVRVAAAVACVPDAGGAIVTVGVEVYPLPAVVRVMVATEVGARVAAAAAPDPPPPVKVIVGAVT